MTNYSAHLVEVACGRRSADLYIENGSVLNVYSGEILTGIGVAVASGRVAYVGPARGMIGPETRLIDAGEGILVPGYVDPHAHFDCFVSMRTLSEAVLPLGTTTIVNDTLAMVARFGAPGLAYLRAAADRLPLNVYFTVPASGWAPELEEQGYPGGLHLSDEELAELLEDERVLGTSEFLTWRRLLSGDPGAISRLELARARGKRCEGHCPGARPDQLQALAAAGISDCHEAIAATDALDRLRAGMYVILRHGPARTDLPELAPLALREGVDRSRLMLSPDWLPPGDLVKFGHMDHPIAVALEQGIPPLDAYRMATVNPARYMRIEEHVGAIAPGRHADILCLDTLEQPRPRWVMAGGRMVAREGRPTPGWMPSEPEPSLPQYRPPVLEAVAADFRLRVDRSGEVTVPAIRIIDKTITRRVDLRLPVRDGIVAPDGSNGEFMKMAMPKPEGGFAVGFLVGVGAPLGGLSSSVASEPYHTLVIGSNDEDMAIAYNRMVRLGGGVVAAHDGRVDIELPLEAGGFISTAPVAATAAGIEGVNQWARKWGSSLENIFLTTHFLTYVGVPFLRMTPWGIYDVKDHVFLPPVID